MKRTFLPLLVVSMVLTACVPSLHPLYTAETIVFREELIGIWREKAEDEESWTFTKGEDGKSYALNIKEEKVSSLLEARLVKLGENLFLDLVADGDLLEEKAGDMYKASLIPGHLILKVKLGETLELQMLNAEKLKDLLKANPKELGHTLIEKDYLVITASTEELQRFVRKHAESEELWGDATVMRKLVL
jgi:hypothetical protein